MNNLIQGCILAILVAITAGVIEVTSALSHLVASLQKIEIPEPEQGFITGSPDNSSRDNENFVDDFHLNLDNSRCRQACRDWGGYFVQGEGRCILGSQEFRCNPNFRQNFEVS